MRTILFLICALFMSTAANAQKSSRLDGTIPCKDISLPYWFSYDNIINGGGGYSEILSKDVKATEGSINNGTVAKWRTHVKGSSITIKYTLPSVADIPTFRGCVDQVALNQCVSDALHMWASACPFDMFDFVQVSSLATGESGIAIVFDDNAADFGSTRDPLRMAGGLASETYDFSADSADIKTSKVRINVSDAFYSHYILTTCPQKCTILKPQYPLSVCALILHELGHSFDLQDLHGKTADDWWESVMYGEEGAGKTDPCGPNGRNYPTDLDVCYFCKLYCPSNCESLVAPELDMSFNASLEIAPNPAHQFCRLHYVCSDPAAVIEIQNILGSTVSALEVAAPEGDLRLSFTKMPAGVYIVRFHSRHAHISRMVVVK